MTSAVRAGSEVRTTSCRPECVLSTDGSILAAWAAYFEDGKCNADVRILSLMILQSAPLCSCVLSQASTKCWEKTVLLTDWLVSATTVYLFRSFYKRLQVDSLKLWKTICSSKLLENATFILFINKSDILEKKLKAGVHFATRFPMTEDELGTLDLGIRFVDYVEQYREQPNDFDHVSTCQSAPVLRLSSH